MAVTVVTAGSTRFPLSLVLPPAPFAHLSSALTPQLVPKCWAVMISPYLQLLWKKQFLQSGDGIPGLVAVTLTLHPLYPWPTSGAAHLQSLYLVFLWWVVRGRPPLSRRAARLCARTTGSLNALKSCSVLSTVRPGPPQRGAFGLSLHGEVVSCSRDSWPLHSPTAWDAGVEGASWRPEGVTIRGGDGTWGYYWKYPTAIAEVSATGLPSPAS